MTPDASFAASLLGFILLLSLASGMVGFAVGWLAHRRASKGPTRTIEVYEGPGVPF